MIRNLPETFTESINPYLRQIREAEIGQTDLPLWAGTRVREFPIAGYLNEKKIFVEIGCHYGSALEPLSRSHPSTLFLGIENKFKRAVRAARRLRPQANVQVLAMDARDLPEVLPRDTIDCIALFYPDPWRNNRLRKHRLFDQDFCDRVRALMKPGGMFWLRTDDSSYFENCRTFFANDRVVAANPWHADFTTCFEKHTGQRYECLWEIVPLS